MRDGLAAGAVASLIGPTACVTRAGQPTKSAGRPNIVFILADDYGLDGMGCYGSDRRKGQTPNLDALASGGIRFELCYSTPLFGPTRCQIMTGRYPFRTGGKTISAEQEAAERDRARKRAQRDKEAQKKKKATL